MPSSTHAAVLPSTAPDTTQDFTASLQHSFSSHLNAAYAVDASYLDAVYAVDASSQSAASMGPVGIDSLQALAGVSTSFEKVPGISQQAALSQTAVVNPSSDPSHQAAVMQPMLAGPSMDPSHSPVHSPSRSPSQQDSLMQPTNGSPSLDPSQRLYVSQRVKELQSRHGSPLSPERSASSSSLLSPRSGDWRAASASPRHTLHQPTIFSSPSRGFTRTDVPSPSRGDDSASPQAGADLKSSSTGHGLSSTPADVEMSSGSRLVSSPSIATRDGTANANTCAKVTSSTSMFGNSRKRTMDRGGAASDLTAATMDSGRDMSANAAGAAKVTAISSSQSRRATATHDASYVQQQLSSNLAEENSPEYELAPDAMQGQEDEHGQRAHGLEMSSSAVELLCDDDSTSQVSRTQLRHTWTLFRPLIKSCLRAIPGHVQGSNARMPYLLKCILACLHHASVQL